MRNSLLIVLMVACGCTSTISTTTYQKSAIQNDERSAVASASTLGSGDVFEIRVYNEQELSGAYRVSPEGSIDFPLVGDIHVVGLTPNQIAARVRDKLKSGSIRSPHVTVYVREYNSKKVFVLGQVQKPGTFSFQENMSVVQVITMAGGFTDKALKNGTIVTRNINGTEKRIPVPVERISGGFARNFQLVPGDIIFVPESIL